MNKYISKKKEGSAMAKSDQIIQNEKGMGKMTRIPSSGKNNAYIVNEYPDIAAIEVNINSQESSRILVDSKHVEILTQKPIYYDKTKKQYRYQYNKSSIRVSQVSIAINTMENTGVQIDGIESVFKWISNYYKNVINQCHHRMGEADIRFCALQAVPHDQTHKKFRQIQPEITESNVLKYIKTADEHCLKCEYSKYDASANPCKRCPYIFWNK
jgi:hypothetical protein